MPYLGNSLSVQQYAPQIAYFSGNGSTTAFTLPVAVVSAAQIIVAIDNVIQNPSSAFSVSGTTITFTSAPLTGTNNIWVEYTSLQTNTIAPSAGTVQNSSFGNLTSIPFAVGGPIGGGDSSAMKNRIINGAMVIDQRYAGTATANTINGYVVDRWVVQQTVTNKLIAQQNAGGLTGANLPTGFNKYLGVTSQSAYSVAAGNAFGINQLIEGFNIADLGWGTANAKTVTLSFQVYSSLTGTFGGALNNNSNYSYPFTYSIPVANTWTTISITVAGPTSGTWASDNSAGISLYFGLGVGSTYSGTAGSWSANYYLSATGATSVVGTSGATFYITGVQLEVGSSATGFEYRLYNQELSACQRYYAVLSYLASTYFNTGFGAGSGTAGFSSQIYYPVTVRATPVITLPPTALTGNSQCFMNASGNFPTAAGSNAAVNINTTGFRITGSGYTDLTNASTCPLYSVGPTSITISAEL